MNRSKQFEDYYTAQVGHGLPVFSGTSMQRGHGLGNVFRGLARTAIPLMKRGMAQIGKKALSTGAAVAKDALMGKNIKRSVKRRAKKAGRELLAGWAGSLAPPGQRARPIKRAASKSRVSSQAKKRRKTTQRKDIFG